MTDDFAIGGYEHRGPQGVPNRELFVLVLKRRLALTHSNDRPAYMEGKATFITQLRTGRQLR